MHGRRLPGPTRHWDGGKARGAVVPGEGEHAVDSHDDVISTLTLVVPGAGTRWSGASADARVLARRGVLPHADVRRLGETVLDDDVVEVVLRDRDRLDDHRGDLARPVVGLVVDQAPRRLRALRQGVGQLGGRFIAATAPPAIPSLAE